MSISDVSLKIIDKFCYLGNVASPNTMTENNIRKHIGAASNAFRKLVFAMNPVPDCK